jgi:hypothetical protein
MANHNVTDCGRGEHARTVVLLTLIRLAPDQLKQNVTHYL